ncbi:MAG: stage II sporulation protein M [Oscillospiraceae bacterium]|nr:stage II sporulation protein M [Oscillospiraceae bacterium]
MREFLKKEASSLQEFYVNSLRVTFENCAVVFVLIFALCLVMGFMRAEETSAVVEGFIENVDELGVVDEDGTISVSGLFANNVLVAAWSVLYGFLPFIFLSALPLGSNAYILGSFGAYYVSAGLSPLSFAAGILPHGIFELTALVFACALGIHLCRELTRFIFAKPCGRPFSQTVRCALRAYLLVCVPLMGIAALIETYVTPHIMALTI